ncbi:hypothetical protein [Nostoc sp.]|uniref:hypothetical protein n=1 Tax=Nostoc sp. TaxID=1180 RepID=UPI002FF57C66
MYNSDRFIFEVFCKAIAYNAIIELAIALEMWKCDVYDGLDLRFYIFHDERIFN